MVHPGGFIGGSLIPVIERFEAGFAAGVYSVNKEIQVIPNYTGAFDDPSRGKAVAESMAVKGADVIFHATGATSLSMIEAAEAEGLWSIGVDSDQHHVAPNFILSSMVKRVDIAILGRTKTLLELDFKARTFNLGIADGGA